MKKSAEIAYEKLCNDLRGKNHSDILSHWYLGKFMLFLKKECGLEFKLDEEVAFDKYLTENTIYVKIRKEVMREINSLLSKQSIEVVFFKGEFISTLLYDSCIRPVGDLDFYISPDKFDEAFKILLNNGFSIIDMDDKHHYKLMKKGLKIEMHKSILSPFTKIENCSFIENLVEREIDGQIYKTFDITGTFLHMLFHLYMDLMLVDNFYSIITTGEIAKARRYEYRAYEIASFLELYYDSIDPERVHREINKYSYTYDFLYMLDDINSTFYDIKGMQLIRKIYELANKHLVETERIKKYLLEADGDGIKAASNYLLEQWHGKTIVLASSPTEIVMNNAESALNETGTYILGDSPFSDNDFSSIVRIEKLRATVSVKFTITDNVLVFDNERRHNPSECDCVGLFLINQNPYVYKQFFAFPYHNEDGVLLVDVVNNVTGQIEIFEATANITEKGYNIQIAIPFASFQNEECKEFYMEIHIADCDEQGESKKTTFALSGNNEKWFDPSNYVKFIK